MTEKEYIKWQAERVAAGIIPPGSSQGMPIPDVCSPATQSQDCGAGKVYCAGPEVPYTVPKRQMWDRYKNDWEREYARELDLMKMAGEILDWRYEPIRIRLAKKTHYVPDFLVVRCVDAPTAGGEAVVSEYREVKGHWREKSLAKFKIAADQLPWFRFLAIRKKKVKEGGGWEVIKELNG